MKHEETRVDLRVKVMIEYHPVTNETVDTRVMPWITLHGSLRSGVTGETVMRGKRMLTVYEMCRIAPNKEAIRDRLDFEARRLVTTMMVELSDTKKGMI